MQIGSVTQQLRRLVKEEHMDVLVTFDKNEYNSKLSTRQTTGSTLGLTVNLMKS